MGTPFENFVNLELPRRPALLTLEITTYDGDPNLGGAPAVLQAAPKGTFYLQDTGAILWRKQTALATSWVQVAGASTDTASNVGTGEVGAQGVFASKVGSDFQFKSLVPGTGVTLTPFADHIQIDATGAGGGEANTASNLGATATRQGLFFAKSGVDLRFKSLVPGANITMSADDDEILINSTGGVSPVVGHISIADVTPNGGGVVDGKTYIDPPVNSIIDTCTSSTSTVLVSVRSSYPKVIVDGVSATLPLVGGVYFGTVAITVAAATITAEIDTPNGASTTATVNYDSPPEILTLSFTGTYPGAQTELKAGDTVQITGTTDKATTGIEVIDYGAGISQTVNFASTTSFTVSITVADRGNIAQLLPARVRAKNASGAFGANRDTNFGGGLTELVHLVNLNNLHPSIAFGAITYPLTQGALKDAETASVVCTTSNLDSIVFDSPNAQLSITDPTVIGTPKSVSRIDGNYNISVNNLRGVATRAANAATTTAQTIVRIAHVAAGITVTEPAARLRSGGNDGTSAQNHTITITSDQQLLSAPTLSAGAGGGALQGAAWAGGPTVYTRLLQVHDNDVKGTYNWTGLSATNLAGIETTAITGNTSYVLGGFVQRNFTFPAFTKTVTMNVAVIDYTKLVAGIFTATNQPAVRMAAQGDTSNAIDRFTVLALATNPVTLHWNDTNASNSNSSGTAQILAVEETV